VSDTPCRYAARLDFWDGLLYIHGMETITIPILLLMSLATALATAGGVWFVTQKRVRDLEVRADRHDQKFDQVIAAIGDLRADMTAGLNGLRADMTAEINSLRTEINDVKVEVARVQGSNMALNEKFDLFLQGRLIPAATQSANVAAA